MIKFLDDVLSAEILLYQERAKLGGASGLVFSPENGGILAIKCFDPIEKKQRFIPVSEIKRFSGRLIVVNGYDSLARAEDLVRLRHALQVDAKVVGERVVTELGRKLGKVVSVTIDTQDWKLSRLYIDPTIGLRFFGRQLLIPAKQIVRIEKKRIIVKDTTVRAGSADPAIAVQPF